MLSTVVIRHRYIFQNMSYRFMRVIVFFDLPMETNQERKEYTKFRKYLIKSGFLMMQKSVYCKLVLNGTAYTTLVEQVKRNKPSDGNVQLLAVTERQYARIEYILGENKSDVLNSDERIIEL